ncbi:MAG: hypothetical protein CVU50_03040 [Candidatus Cloacimonetes bacterium HGW-Cloacimonetes-3]|nr:MAG: hypothetical protein CVU50_03040 [Candidatus Cloacimonetes bacterium HGW-Cloacimonetes-3]
MLKINLTQPLVYGTQFKPLSTTLHCILLMCLTLLISSCNKPTENQNVSISGSVTLINDSNDPTLNPLDFSGVTVALYDQAILDTTIVRINHDYQNIGVQISQETEFDHRYQSPIAVTTTTSDGKYVLNNIPVGIYNMVFFKQRWSIVYKYNVNAQRQNGSNNMGAEEIFPAEEVSGFVNSAFTFQDNRTYFIANDTSFLDQAIFQTGSVIMVNSGVSVTFYDTVTTINGETNQKFWRICSSYNAYSSETTQLSSANYFNSVSYRGDNVSINNGLFRHVSNGIIIAAQNAHVHDIDLKDFDSGVLFDNSQCSIDKVNIRSGNIRGIQALSIDDSLSISNSIIYKNSDGLIIYTGGGFLVSNTFFYDNETAIRPENCTGVIQNNNFELNSVDILQYLSNCQILKNNFYFSKGLSIRPRSFALINYNNFYKTGQYFINIRRLDGSHTYVQANVDAKQNYWNVTNIDDYILDASDNVNYPGQECPYFVITTNRLSNPNTSAGILN